MKEYIKKLLKEQREICAQNASLQLNAGRPPVVNRAAILNAPSPEIDLEGVSKWVKASERLPGKFGMYICKLKVIEEGLTFHPVSYVQFDTINNEWTNPRVCCTPGDVVEWLDESGHNEKIEQAPSQEWSIGDKFTTPETGEQVFTVTKVKVGDVEARDKRSRAGYTNFSQSYIKKIEQAPELVDEIRSGAKIIETANDNLQAKVADLERQLAEARDECMNTAWDEETSIMELERLKTENEKLKEDLRAYAATAIHMKSTIIELEKKLAEVRDWEQVFDDAQSMHLQEFINYYKLNT